MELDIRIGKESLSITIENPLRIDTEALVNKIDAFLTANGVKPGELDLRGILPRMVKGIAGCEAGCPSDAHSVVKKGHKSFKLEYIEGGILSATAQLGQGKTLSIKLFPDF